MYTMKEKKEMIHKIANAKARGDTKTVFPFGKGTLEVVFEDTLTVFRLLIDGVCKKTIISEKQDAQCDDYFTYGFNILGTLDCLAR